MPFFLASIGLHLNLAAFLEPRIFAITAAICLIAVESKFIGCGLGAWNLGRRDMVRIGVGMVPRGDVGMVVAQLGLSLGVVEHDVYASVVAMAIVTILVAPPLLN
ncbi:MAG: cation:proton antiporter [Acidobacteriaceae bacterium]|nr:cation:proton antiporter [Acidobacteriaceae bacterium]